MRPSQGRQLETQNQPETVSALQLCSWCPAKAFACQGNCSRKVARALPGLRSRLRLATDAMRAVRPPRQPCNQGYKQGTAWNRLSRAARHKAGLGVCHVRSHSRVHFPACGSSQWACQLPDSLTLCLRSSRHISSTHACALLPALTPLHILTHTQSDLGQGCSGRDRVSTQPL